MSNLINESFTLPCGQILKNRVCKAAMTERIANGDNLARLSPFAIRSVIAALQTRFFSI